MVDEQRGITPSLAAYLNYSHPSRLPFSKAALCISIIMVVMIGCTTRPSTVTTIPESLPINCEPANSTERLIVSNRQMSLTVVDIEVAVEKVQKIMAEFDGYIDQEQTQVFRSKEANFTVRLPKDSLSEASEEIKMTAKRVNNEWAIGQDKTEQYADLEEQLCELKQQSAALQERIAYNPGDQLSDQFVNLESEVELIRGKIVYRDERLALARLTLHLSVE